MSQSTQDVESVQDLREAMVQDLINKGAARSSQVIAALRAVPRHLVEGAEPTEAYSRRVIGRKTGDDGVTLSTISAVHIQALQLEQADLQPGHRVLEIGSGGVNAAYLREIVGPQGTVVTMDIDPEITARAETFLAAAGYDDVVVVTGDAAFGVEQHAPFDRIVVTVETTDVPPAWWDQLADDGIIVAPVRWRGLSRSVALVRTGPVLTATDIQQAGFVPMQGAGEERQNLLLLNDAPDERVAFRVEGHAESYDATALSASLHSEPTYRWTNVTLTRGSSYEHVNLWLGAVLDPLLILTGDPGARKGGLIASAHPIGTPALVEETSFAYHTVRPTDDPEQFELGAVAHGPRAAEVADRYADAIRRWDPERSPVLTITRDLDTPVTEEVDARSVDRRNARFTISWR